MDSEPSAEGVVSQNIVWSHSEVSAEQRTKLLGHRGATIWFTGLSGSGKSTIAVATEKALVDQGCLAYVLDGDNVRHGLNGDLGFGPDDRTENIRRIGEVCKLFVDSGVLTLTAFVSPYRSDRDGVRGLHSVGAFIEVFVDTPLEVCESRDVKGLYAKARAGEIPEFTGISAPYEAPDNPEITIKTADRSVEDCVTEVLDRIGELIS